jgi:glutamate-1-semialdehyde 2,1-aminomutase
LLDETNPYARLDQLGKKLCATALDAAKRKGLPLQAPQVGSMFSLFYTSEPVRDYATALKSDAKIFGRFFHACLERGIYLPPSAYETWFLSTAHEGATIDRACEIVAQSIQSL